MIFSSETNYPKVGERFRVERDRLALSQEAMATCLGVSRRTLLAWEKGEQFPNGLELSQAADMGADVLYVLTGQRTPTPAQSLSPEDSELLADYRAATPEDQVLVRRMLALVAEHCRQKA